jgi:bifunctional enzyme CysN/CysC
VTPPTGCTVWVTGLSGSGKSTLTAEVAAALAADGRACTVLDGDALRTGLNADLGFGRADRAENVRRVGEVAILFARAGHVVLVPVISPYAADRAAVRYRHLHEGVPFVEVYLDVPLQECEARDPKGLYARARAGAITGFTGIDDPYEPPTAPELRILPGADVSDDAELVLALLR